MEVGQTVAASLQSPEIFIIARNLAEMQVETSIDESDVGRIEEGQEATFTVDAFPGRVFNSKVKQIRKAPVNIQNVVTYTVLITADNPDFKLLPGMTANARIEVDHRDQTLKIPNSALRFRMPMKDVEKKPGGETVKAPPKLGSGGRSASGNSFRSVYVLEGEGSRAEPVKKSFRIGLTDADYSEILPLKNEKEPQLKEGDKVIVGIEGGNNGKDKGSAPGGPRMF